MGEGGDLPDMAYKIAKFILCFLKNSSLDLGVGAPPDLILIRKRFVFFFLQLTTSVSISGKVSHHLSSAYNAAFG